MRMVQNESFISEEDPYSVIAFRKHSLLISDLDIRKQYLKHSTA